MSVLIKARKSPFPDKETGKTLYYPAVKSRGMVSTDDLARAIAEKSSLTPGDIRNVLENLGETVNQFFRLGFSVKLDKLGILHLTVNAQGNGVESPEDVGPAQVNAAHVIFREEKHRSGKTTRTTLSDEIIYEMDHSADADPADATADTGDAGDTGSGDTGSGDTSGDSGDSGDLLG